MTLDAGGTNFVFSAIGDGKEIAKPLSVKACGDDLELCLKNIIKGFEAIRETLGGKADAISFAFPGPADYARGIIGDLENLPAFRGGVALGPMLEDRFGLPVFINNDGDLFAYGEAMHGFLPELNERLRLAGSEKQYKNLMAITLGTGFGGGIVRNNGLLIGDNGAAGEVWLLRNPVHTNSFAEESISARAIVKAYSSLTNATEQLSPEDVYQIAKGAKHGDIQAARTAFEVFGRALGAVLAEAITLLDSPVVIGGGLANAWSLFSPAMFNELNGTIASLNGKALSRLVMKVCDIENEAAFEDFAKGERKTVAVPFSPRRVAYDPLKRIGIGRSVLGTSRAIALGAYAFAVNALKG